MPELNDVQSRLNKEAMLSIAEPRDSDEVSRTIVDGLQKRISLCPAGSLHSVGGQQWLKRQYDPCEVFASDWYRHYRDMFEGGRGG